MNLKFACVFAVLILVGTSASAQQPGRIRYEGTEVFRFALYKKQLKELVDIQEKIVPRETIIIITGDTSRAPPPFASGHWLAEPERLWQRILQKKGAAFRLLAEAPDDPSLN